MLLVRPKGATTPPPRLDLDRRALASVVEAGYLMASCQGELDDDAREALAGLVVGLIEGLVPVGEVMVLIESCDEALERDGYDVRISAVLEGLPSVTLRRLALLCSAAVLHNHTDFRHSYEGELYLAFALSLGFVREDAFDMLDEARRIYAT